MRLTSPVTPAASRSCAIQATNLVKSFVTGQEVVRAVRGISLDVQKGEVVTLEGPSGSGKTTLLCLLGCMLTPDSGNLLIDGREVDPKRPERLPEFRRSSIGFVFQQFNLFPALTARENILYALKIKGVTGKPARLEASRMIEAVGLTNRERARPRELSGGQKQRVAIARALAGPASILLADEPTANLDAQTGLQILDIFRELARRENRAVVIVTHDPKVRRIADRVCTIHDGLLTELDSDQFQGPSASGPESPPDVDPDSSSRSIAGSINNVHSFPIAPIPTSPVRRYPTTLAFRNRSFYSPVFLPRSESSAIEKPPALPGEYTEEQPLEVIQPIAFKRIPSPPPAPEPFWALSTPVKACALAPCSRVGSRAELSNGRGLGLLPSHGSTRLVERTSEVIGSELIEGLRVDSFHFVGRIHSGDGEVGSWIDAPNGSSAGLMYRDASEPDAPYVGLVITPGRGVSLLWRAETGGTSFEMTDLTVQGRTHLKLVRQGNSFTGYVSIDDRVESKVGSTTIPLRTQAFLGFAVSRGIDSKPIRAKFEGTSVS